MDEIAKIDRALDEILVHLGGLVLKLSSDEITKTTAEHQALVKSVSQYSVCAVRSSDPRVKKIEADLQRALKPQLRLVVNQ